MNFCDVVFIRVVQVVLHVSWIALVLLAAVVACTTLRLCLVLAFRLALIFVLVLKLLVSLKLVAVCVDMADKGKVVLPALCALLRDCSRPRSSIQASSRLPRGVGGGVSGVEGVSVSDVEDLGLNILKRGKVARAQVINDCIHCVRQGGEEEGSFNLVWLKHLCYSFRYSLQ
jgi:hypothetical protein